MRMHVIDCLLEPTMVILPFTIESRQLPSGGYCYHGNQGLSHWCRRDIIASRSESISRVSGAAIVEDPRYLCLWGVPLIESHLTSDLTTNRGTGLALIVRYL